MYNTTYKCKFCHETFTGHQGRIVCSGEDCITKRKAELRKNAQGISKKARSKAKIKKKLTKNTKKCVRCGKPKGINRWYCSRCLKYLSRLYGDLELYSVSVGRH